VSSPISCRLIFRRINNKFFLFLLLMGIVYQRAESAQAECGALAGMKPAASAELLALVAGNALPENVAHEVECRGVNFRVTDEYRGWLKAAGAQDGLVSAITKAKLAGSAAVDRELLQHLANAGARMQEKKFEDAAKELSAALEVSVDGPEAGFVMGELLRRRENYGQALRVYREVQRKSPEFPEVHTKLAYILLKVDDFADAAREAHAALDLTPNNAEAHRNMGIVLSKQNFDAAIAEYQQALALKPDYALARYSLGMLYSERGDLDRSAEEYRKAIALDPTDWRSPYNLALVLERKKDWEGAIRAYREAKLCDPTRIDVRLNLASALNHRDAAAAVREYKELAAMAPDLEVCHVCYGGALLKTGDVKGAEAQELRKRADALQLLQASRARWRSKPRCVVAYGGRYCRRVRSTFPILRVELHGLYRSSARKALVTSKVDE
jgi:tetratricopeptide (TPR) repeat protein